MDTSLRDIGHDRKEVRLSPHTDTHWVLDRRYPLNHDHKLTQIPTDSKCSKSALCGILSKAFLMSTYATSV